MLYPEKNRGNNITGGIWVLHLGHGVWTSDNSHRWRTFVLCLFSQQAAAYYSTPSLRRREFSLSLSHLRDWWCGKAPWRAAATIQDRCSHLAEEKSWRRPFILAYTKIRFIIRTSLLLRSEKLSRGNLRQQGCSKTSRNQFHRMGTSNLNRVQTYVPTLDLRPPGTPWVQPSITIFLHFLARDQARQLWEPRQAALSSYHLCALWPYKMNTTDYSIPTLPPHFSVPLGCSVPLRSSVPHLDGLQRSLQTLLTYLGSKNNFTPTWNYKKLPTKLLKTYYSFNCIPQVTELGQPWRCVLEVWPPSASGSDRSGNESISPIVCTASCFIS